MSFLDPMGDAFEDVEITDVVFSQMGKNKDYRVGEDGITPQQDTNVVIINVGGLDKTRLDIGAMVNAANKGGAKVIALDVFFESMKPDSMADSFLQEAFQRVPNLVLVNELMGYNDQSGYFDSLKTSLPFFNRYAINGFANMVTENKGDGNGQFNVCRKFMPAAIDSASGKKILSFPMKICEIYDSSKIVPFVEREELEEYINYVGNINLPFKEFLFPSYYKQDRIAYLDKPYYNTIEHSCAINAFWKSEGVPEGHPLYHQGYEPIDLDIFRNKIVLIGYVGERVDIETGEDKFYTPLNENYIGKANRDMYGIVVHANIISTILNGNVINVMPNWLAHLLGMFVVYFVFAAFRPIYDDYKVWYDGVTKTMGLVLSMIILFIIGAVFEKYDYQIRFGSMYFACVLLAGDFLEIYYGLIRNVGRKIKNKFVSLSSK